MVSDEKIFIKGGSISNMSLTSWRLRPTPIECPSRADLPSVYTPNRPVARLPVCIAATISGVNLTHASFTTIDRSHGGASVACQTWSTSSSRRGASNSLRSARQHARASATMIYVRCRYNVVRTTSSPASARPASSRCVSGQPLAVRLRVPVGRL